MQCKDRYIVRISQKYNKKHATAFVRKNAEKRFLGPFNLTLRTSPPPYFENCTDILSPEEEFQLFTALHFMKYKIKTSEKTRDRYFDIYIALRNRAISANWALVPYCVKKHSKKFYNLDTAFLMGKGHELLIAAVDCFDPWLGFRFCTYAWNAIYKGFLPKKSRNQPEIKPIDEKISDSLTTDSSDDSQQLWLERLEIILQRKFLTQREKEIIKYRFGLDNHDRLTFKELSKMWNITKERVRQIQIDVLDKIKNELLNDPVLH